MTGISGTGLHLLKERFFGDVIDGIIGLIFYGIYFLLVEYLINEAKIYENGDAGSLFLYSLAAIYVSFSGLGILIVYRFIFYPLFSGNIGHRIMGIKVINADEGTDCKELSKCF